MKKKELIKHLYHFIMELAMKVDRKDFDKLRDKWNILIEECETKIKINGNKPN